MKCYDCKQQMAVTGGMFPIPVYDFQKGEYLDRKFIVIECPLCQALIAIDGELKPIESQIPVDDAVQT